MIETTNAPMTNARRRAPRPTRPRLPVWLGALAVALIGSSAGSAATASAATSVSSNWAGYAVSGASGTKYKRVAGTWVQPAVTCTPGSASYSAYWVGLGGYKRTSSRLEQTGTQATCNAAGRASYSAWYEVVPAPSVGVRLRIFPGDRIGASVTVVRRSVVLRVRDQTRGTVFTRRVRMSAPDSSSAEWVVEAPAECDGAGSCTALPLANFGTANFLDGTATTTRGHTGTIADRAWSATSISLQSDTGGASRPGAFGAAVAAAAATPSALSATGGSFSVTWQQQTATAPGPPGGIYPGFGGA